MALADEIQALERRTLSALDAGHDYYTHTKRVWRLVQQIVKEGRSFTFRNLARLGCPTSDQVGRLAEIKASRDILIHNNGVANTTYNEKAGTYARCKDGERLPISEHYHRETWETIRKVVADVSTAATAKARPRSS